MTVCIPNIDAVQTKFKSVHLARNQGVHEPYGGSLRGKPWDVTLVRPQAVKLPPLHACEAQSCGGRGKIKMAEVDGQEVSKDK